MGEREPILVAYASRAGSTKEIAREISAVLTRAGDVVDLRPIDDVTDLKPYRAVVIGSPVHGAQWLPEAINFVKLHRDTLRRLPVAYFVVSATLRVDNRDNRAVVASYLDPVRAIVEPIDIGLFGGVIDPSKLPLYVRLMFKLTRTPTGDFRNWGAIRAWANRLHMAFARASARRPQVANSPAAPASTASDGGR